MVRYTSNFTKNELINRWDEYTSPARFAGADETLDLIFSAKRSGDSVKLTRRTKLSRDPFSPIFHGKIKSTKQGSEIVGYYTKSIIDYLLVGFVMGLLFCMRSFIIERGESLNTINSLLIIGIIGSFILLKNTRVSKRKFSELIFKITDNELPLFLNRKEIKELENKDV